MNRRYSSAHVPIQYQFVAFVVNINYIFTSLNPYFLRNELIITGKLHMKETNEMYLYNQ